MKTVLSTLPGKHGDEHSHSEVPRVTLVTALLEQPEFHSTHRLQGVLFGKVQIGFDQLYSEHVKSGGQFKHWIQDDHREDWKLRFSYFPDA